MKTPETLYPFPLLPTAKNLSLTGITRTINRSSLKVRLEEPFLSIQKVVVEELQKLQFSSIVCDTSGPNSSSQLIFLASESLDPEDRLSLQQENVPEQSYVLEINERQIRIGALTAHGALYGLATLAQMLSYDSNSQIPCLKIIDGPDVPERVISPTLTWYAGFARIGFGMQLWDGERWKRFVDWCFIHKINSLNIVMYGFWPFEFPEYPETVLRNISVKTWSKETRDWLDVSFTHPNLIKPFLSDIINYANRRGISMYAYIGLNSYSGGYPVVHPESRAVLSDELQSKGHVNSYDSMCPSRPEVREYLINNVKRIEELGFNGLVFEESEEVQWFCQCEECQLKYGHLAPNDAKHTVSVELLQEYSKVLSPVTLMGVRWLREPPIVKSESYLQDWANKLPKHVKLFWAPGLEDDDREFLKWIGIFGKDRIYSRNCEGSGFAASLGRIPYLIPDTFPDTLKNYAFQHLWNDISQFQGAVNQNCTGINGYGFEWYGHEHYFMAAAQYGWDCWRFGHDDYLTHGSRHLFGEENGARYERIVRNIPCIHETQICEKLPSFPFMPNKYVGDEGSAYLGLMADQAELVLTDLQAILQTPGLTDIQSECAEATLLMAKRMQAVIRAGLYYNHFLTAMKNGTRDLTILRHYAKKSLHYAEENYSIIKENYFDSHDHTWTGVAIGEYYIPLVINEYKKVFSSVLGDEFAPDPSIAPIVGGESLPWEWLLEWGPRIAKAKPTAAIREGNVSIRVP
ncbi:hypothetical protein SD71_13310 [Cohnella kolymensis]|uniref:Beta-hexosaminidase bacterial type N-terminal domain-containing protein n=1 Tax=Cohnella kolymensis TaxID=1590652 RepID=A0ABR5A4W5_9BACL|nr:glycoside hydrolase family 20 zincin-like fold domain-containing protein [Cohnella kolymensis]KIL35487.1 hypothetical protein SD71_13310 [Cohnella kolymensis]